MPEVRASQVAQWRCRRRGFDQKYLLKEEVAAHSSILAWGIPQTEEHDSYYYARKSQIKFKTRLGDYFPQEVCIH